MTHLMTMFRMVEDNKGTPQALHLMLQYDDLLRQNLAHRSERKDPELCLVASFRKLNKEVLRHAQSKVDEAFRRLGAPQFSGFSGSGLSPVLSAHPGSLVAAAQSMLRDLGADMANRGTAMSDGKGAAPSRSVDTTTKGQQGNGGKGTGSHKGGGGGGGGGSGGGTSTFSNRALSP